MIMYVFVQKHSSTHKNPPISGWPPKHNRGTIHNFQLHHQLTSCPKHCWWRRQQHEWGGRSAQRGPHTAAASACTHRPSCQEGAVTLACHFHTGCATGSPAHPSACGRTSLGTTRSGWQAPENRCSLLHTFLVTKLSADSCKNLWAFRKVDCIFLRRLYFQKPENRMSASKYQKWFKINKHSFEPSCFGSSFTFSCGNLCDGTKSAPEDRMQMLVLAKEMEEHFVMQNIASLQVKVI